MKKAQSGLTIVELLIIIGLIAVVSVAMLSMMNNMFKGMSAAQKSSNRTEMMRALSTALSNTETCKEAMGAGTRSVPTNWASGPTGASKLNIDRVQVGAEKIAEVGATANDVRVTAMTLELLAGPFPVQYNVAPVGSNPDLRDYRRYFAKLVVSAEKVGGTQNNLGGEAFKDSEFRMAILARDTNVLHDCYGGIDESDLLSLCERGFEGQYDATKFPWCTTVNFSVGVHRSDLPPLYPRFAVLEKQNPTTPSWDLTMALYGNGVAGSNGPAIWFARDRSTAITNTGNLAAIGYANRVNAYTMGSKAGDFVITNRSPTGDLEIGTLDVHLKMNQATKNATFDRGLVISAVGSNTPSAHPLTVNAPDGQGRIVIAGTSDAGETFSALYLSNADPVNPLANSWVLAHKAAASGNLNSVHLNRWQGGVMYVGFVMTPALNFGIGTTTPSEKLDVAGNAVVNGTFRATGNATFGGNITAAGSVTAASDLRLKKNVKELENPLEKLLQLRPVTYEWKKSQFSSQRQIGFIAQEIEQVIPEVVLTAESGVKSVAYGNISAMIVGAIKELYRKIVVLLNDSEETKSRLQEMENKINQLLEAQKGLEMRNSFLEKKLQQALTTCSTGNPHGAGECGPGDQRSRQDRQEVR